MGKLEVPLGWVHQAYRFEVDRPSRHRSIPSHEGARRFAWNWALDLIEGQLHAKETFRVLALRQGATPAEAEAFATEAARIPYLAEMNEQRRSTNGNSKPASEWCPWSKEAMRYVWNRVKDEVAPWWAENSKECYSSGFEALAQAMKNHFDSKAGKRKGPQVGWPQTKHRFGRQSVAFSTGAIAVLDRHHVRLPVIGKLRVKEPTDKLRMKLACGTARILRATLVSDRGKTYVSFGVLVQRDKPCRVPRGVCGHDVGISAMVTSSDNHVGENPRAAKQVGKKVSRYQRKMDRQHRTGSPACFAPDGTHIQGTCHWKHRSTRSMKTQARIKKLHAKAANVRRDAIHKASSRAAVTYRVNVVEDLNVSGMGARGRGKRGFNAALSDAALSELRRQLSYKSSWYGSSLWLAQRWYPSSKLCSTCRTPNAGLSRSARVFHCDTCGLSIDRDVNAAKNLAALAELACVCLMAQLMTGEPVDWSALPVRPSGWEPDHSTRSSRGCARARSPKAEGGERKTARCNSAGDRSFDREAAVATGTVSILGSASPSPKKAVA
jgi:putative transposase